MISTSNISLVQVRLVEVQGTGFVRVNDRHLSLKAGMTVDITPSLCEGVNIITFVVSTNSLIGNPALLLNKKNDWMGRFEIYVDGGIAGAYSKQGKYIVGGKENVISSIEINFVKDVSQPTVIQLINRLQQVRGMTDADKADFPKSHPHIIFKNGVAIHTWKNPAGVDHAFVADRAGRCVYGGYIGWIHAKHLRAVLQDMHNSLGEYIAN